MLVRALPMHRPGGLEYHTWDLALGLQARGHEITILTTRFGAANSAPEELPPNISLQFVSRSRPADYSIAFFRYAQRDLERLDRTHHFDVIHSQELAGLFLRAWPGRLVVTVHGTM